MINEQFISYIPEMPPALAHLSFSALSLFAETSSLTSPKIFLLNCSNFLQLVLVI